MIDHEAAEPGAEGVAEVERGDVEARRQALAGAVGLFQHPHLQRRHGGEGGGAEQADEGDGGDLVGCTSVIGGKDDGQRAEGPEQGRHQVAVGELSADEIAQRPVRAEDQQDRRDGGLRRSR